jgi:anti-anti-sigma regulatory factor
MQSSLTIYVGGHSAGTSLSLHGNCTGATEAAHLKQIIAQVITLGSCALWIDCQHVASISTQGQQAILHVEQQAALAHLPVYWCGFSEQLIQELSASGLYGILRSMPASHYQGPDNVREGKTMPFTA